MKVILTSFFICVAWVLPAQDTDVDDRALAESQTLTWEGNRQLSENNFTGAEADYRRAISKNKGNVAAPYNLGNAYYNNESYSEAFGRFKQAGELAGDKTDKHRAYHNMGNVFMKRKEYEKAVEAYKEALRNDPSDDETRYNLALAKELLEKDQQQNQDNENNEDQDQNDENEKDKEQKDEGDNKEQQNDQEQNDDTDQGDQGDQGDEEEKDDKQGEGDEQQEQNKRPEPGEQQQQQRPNQLSKQQIQNLLDAMQNEEKKVQEKIDARKVKGVKVKNEKDW